jgi:hypothetical protein
MKTSKPASYSGFSQFDASVAIPNREFKAIILNCDAYALGIVNITYIDTKGITKTYTVTVMRVGVLGKLIIVPIAGRQLISLTNSSTAAFTLNDVTVTLLN